jgi:hypothetical protein
LLGRQLSEGESWVKILICTFLLCVTFAALSQFCKHFTDDLPLQIPSEQVPRLAVDVCGSWPVRS